LSAIGLGSTGSFIAELEAEVQHYREKSERAEEWLRKISMEIEDRLINQPRQITLVNWIRRDNERDAKASVAAIVSRTMSFRSMRGDEEIELDESRPATLHNGAISTDFPTLLEAIWLGTDSGPSRLSEPP
jgi:hypothetical protein